MGDAFVVHSNKDTVGFSELNRMLTENGGSVLPSHVRNRKTASSSVAASDSKVPASTSAALAISSIGSSTSAESSTSFDAQSLDTARDVGMEEGSSAEKPRSDKCLWIPLAFVVVAVIVRYGLWYANQSK